jgi:hypothetical protein
MNKISRKSILILVTLFFANSCFSQAIILRPYYGRKWFSSNNKNVLENNFDPNYMYKINSSRYITGISIEYQNKKNSFELYFSSQPTLFKSSIFYSLAGYRFSNVSEGAYSQFQLLYNRSLRYREDKVFNFIPVFTGGIGIGIVNSQGLLNNSSYETRYVAPNNEFVEFQANLKKANNFNYSLIFKIGGVLKYKKREIIRMHVIYNLGLNNAEKQEVNYSFTNNKYSGILASKGSYLGLQLSSPIYVKRFKK